MDSGRAVDIQALDLDSSDNIRFNRILKDSRELALSIKSCVGRLLVFVALSMFLRIFFNHKQFFKKYLKIMNRGAVYTFSDLFFVK